MRLPEQIRQDWLSLAERLRSLPSEVFFDGERYHPLRGELAECLRVIDPEDLELVGRIYSLFPKFVPTKEWAEGATSDEVLAALLSVLSVERWVCGAAVEPHENGFLSYALERIANSDAAYSIRS